MSITHEGTVNEKGDEIKLTSKSDSGDFPGMEFTLKKAAAAAPAAAPAPAPTAPPAAAPAPQL
jgi:hypothetical protein